MVRVWRQGGAMVTKVLTTRDMAHPVEEARYCSSANEVCDLVRRFLDPFDRP